jgi:hypothetical protein
MLFRKLVVMSGRDKEEPAVNSIEARKNAKRIERITKSCQALLSPNLN